MTLVAVLRTDMPKEKEVSTPSPKVQIINPDEKLPIETEVKPPLSAYKKINGKPYSAEYFGIDGWEFLSEEGRDLDGVIKKVNTIEDYVKTEIEDKKLNDETASYDEIIERLKGIIGIGKNEKKESRLERIYLYVQLLNKQHALDKKRSELLGI